MSRQAWKGFLGTGLTLGLISCFLWVYYDRLYYANYLNRKPEYSSYKALLLSDSHGLCLERETEKGGIFNFSAESDNYEDLLRKLDWCMARNPNLKLVLLTADAHTLSRYRELMHNNDRSVYFQSFAQSFELNGCSGAYRWLKETFQFYFLLFNPKAGDFIKRSLVGSGYRALGKEATGNLGNFDWSKPENRLFMAQSRFRSQFPDSSRSMLLRRTLSHLVLKCRKQGIRVVGIRFPLSREYGAMVAGHSYGAENEIRDLGCEVLDFSKEFEGRDSLFQDQDHLNRIGGKHFAKMIIEKCRPFL